MWLSASIFFAIIHSNLVVASPALEPRSVGFGAGPSINAGGIFNAARNAKSFVAKFPDGSGTNVNIFDDWLNIGGVEAFGFIADMDVDCDGVDFKCPHNTDGQPQTSFGRLSAIRTPYYVIPQSFFESHKAQIKPNSLGLIICDGKMFYGIMADTDGDTPEVISEASILMAQTCFPNEGLDGGRGHGKANVLYVVIGHKVPPGVGEVTINIPALKKLGDQAARQLANALHV